MTYSPDFLPVETGSSAPFPEPFRPPERPFPPLSAAAPQRIGKGPLVLGEGRPPAALPWRYRFPFSALRIAGKPPDGDLSGTQDLLTSVRQPDHEAEVPVHVQRRRLLLPVRPQDADLPA